MAKDQPGPSLMDNKQYEGLRKRGISKARAAAISNSPGAEKKGGKRSAKKRSAKKRSGGSSTSEKRSSAKRTSSTSKKARAGRKGSKAAAKK